MTRRPSGPPDNAGGIPQKRTTRARIRIDRFPGKDMEQNADLYAWESMDLRVLPVWFYSDVRSEHARS